MPQLQIEENYPEHHSPHKPIQKKLTRAQVIATLLAKQSAQQSDSQHTLEETKGYLKCTNCGISVHKRTNEDAFQAFVQGPCINRPYEQPHQGHARVMPATFCGKEVTDLQCKNCGTQTQTDAQQRPILTNALQKSCKGAAISGSPPITEHTKGSPRHNSEHCPTTGWP